MNVFLFFSFFGAGAGAVAVLQVCIRPAWWLTLYEKLKKLHEYGKRHY